MSSVSIAIFLVVALGMYCVGHQVGYGRGSADARRQAARARRLRA